MRAMARRSGTLRRASFTAVMCAALTAFSAGGAAAATQPFLQIPGIPGESKDRGHEDWIDVISFGLRFTKGKCGGLTVVKRLDLASPALSAAAVSAEEFENMRLETQKTESDSLFVFLRLSLVDARVASVDVKIPPTTGELTETIVVSAAQITMTYHPIVDGRLGPPVKSRISCIP